VAGDGIRVYFGEFLVSAAPTELSGNWCSHACAYCFSNAANPQRQLDLKNVLALLRNSHERKGLDAILLTEKYPVVVSNHVDPFSKSNAKPMLEIMRLMSDLEIPISFQTRGGEEWAIAETLDFIAPSVFYVSITHQTDESRQWIEPNAPAMEHRYAFMKELVSRGHRVLVGLNPLVPEWIPEPEIVLQKLKDIGVEGLWIENLHLNRYQKAGMRPWQQKRMGEDLIKRALKINVDEEHWLHFVRTREAAIAMGFEVYTSGQPNKSYFFEPFHQTYPKTFPVMQDFNNFCQEESVKVVSWELWRNFFYSRLPRTGSTPQHMDYLRQAVHRELSSVPYLVSRNAKRFNYGTVLQYAYWDDRLKKLPFSPLSQSWLKQVVSKGKPVYQDGSGAIHTDKNKGMPLFYVDDSYESLTVEIEC
jgi:DNA repair photolyase